MTTSAAGQLLRELVECSDGTAPDWPPTAGDKVLGRGVSGNPGPTYVLTDPRECDGNLVVTTVSHHQLTAVVERDHHTDPIKDPVEKARQAAGDGRVSPTTEQVERLKLYTLPGCERCEVQGRGWRRPLDRPVPVSTADEEVDVWLCRDCFGFYQGLTAARDGGGVDE